MFSISPENQAAIQQLREQGRDIDIGIGKKIRCTIWKGDPKTDGDETLCNGIKGETVDEAIENAVLEVGLC